MRKILRLGSVSPCFVLPVCCMSLETKTINQEYAPLETTKQDWLLGVDNRGRLIQGLYVQVVRIAIHALDMLAPAQET
jgi:hypothetical protein